jgi:hypothetical protein
MRNDKYLIMLGAALLGSASLMAAPERRGPATESDRIEVIAHLSLLGGPIVHIASDAHWGKNYLYLDQGAARPVKIIDVTNPGAPKAAGQLEIPKPEASGDVEAVVGTAALVTSSTSAPTSQTVTILSFSDSEHPKVEREFSGVTALLRAGSYVYLANADGLFVLKMQPAEDVQLNEQYKQYVLYNP